MTMIDEEFLAGALENAASAIDVSDHDVERAMTAARAPLTAHDAPRVVAALREHPRRRRVLAGAAVLVAVAAIAIPLYALRAGCSRDCRAGRPERHPEDDFGVGLPQPGRRRAKRQHPVRADVHQRLRQARRRHVDVRAGDVENHDVVDQDRVDGSGQPVGRQGRDWRRPGATVAPRVARGRVGRQLPGAVGQRRRRELRLRHRRAPGAPGELPVAGQWRAARRAGGPGRRPRRST